jgi:pyridoxamine 5'-phosphate oxidase
MPEPSLPPLIEKNLDPSAIKQVQRWLKEAVSAKIPQAESMTLATATKWGVPSARIVLLKHVDAEGLVFYTNYKSQKSKELTENPQASLVFYWEELHRQVRIDGTVRKVSPEESDAYFQTRPRESQISAHASPQSEVIGSREELDRRFEELLRKFEGQPVPHPPHWGGYRIKPTRIEFWQSGYARLNDRIVYELQKDGSWKMKRLAP